MQDERSAGTNPPEQENTSQEGTLWRLQGIFFEPGRTFESIKKRPGFILPILLCIGISLVASAAIYSKIDLSDVIVQQIRDSRQGSQMTSEQIEEQVSQIVNSPLYPVMKWAAPLLGPVFLIFIVAGLLMLLVYVAGSETNYTKLLGVTSHSYFFYYLVYSGLTVLVFFLSSDPKAIDIQNPVYTNPGPLVDSGQNPALHRLLTSLDLITLYVMFLLGLGLSKVSRRMSLGKGLTLVGLLYFVYVLLATGWKAFVG